MKSILHNQYNLYIKGDTAVISSRQVAEIFDKRHDNILQIIEALTSLENGLSDDFTHLNFKGSKYKDSSGKDNKQYLLTKDGFTMLVMGFTGKKAIKFKEDYINRFNYMEQYIKTMHDKKADFPLLTQAIQQAHTEPKPYHYTNEINMIYTIVLGLGLKKFRSLNNIDKSKNISQYLTTEQLKQFDTLQLADIGLLYAIPEYNERKQALQRYFNNMILKITA